jgi:hypothetical protein
MSLPANAHNCLLRWYHEAKGSMPPDGSWRLKADASGNVTIADWTLADAIPNDAVVTALAAGADAYVASNLESDATRWTKRERFLLEVLFQIQKQITPAVTRPQFKTALKNYWDAMP